MKRNDWLALLAVLAFLVVTWWVSGGQEKVLRGIAQQLEPYRPAVEYQAPSLPPQFQRPVQQQDPFLEWRLKELERQQDELWYRDAPPGVWKP